MTLWDGFITDTLRESRDFYRTRLGATILWEADWFVLLKVGAHELGFLRPDQPSQTPIFQRTFKGQGTVDRNETWGDRHFSMVDPNGMDIDIVTRIVPARCVRIRTSHCRSMKPLCGECMVIRRRLNSRKGSYRGFLAAGFRMEWS